MDKEGVEVMEPFCLTQCGCIGFDLDHTLIRYRLEAITELVFRVLLRYVIEKAHYSPKLSEVIED